MLTHSQEDFSPMPKETPSFNCYYCKLQFRNSKELRRHVSSHIKVKELFHRQRRLNKPKELLNKEKKFVCNICLKGFLKKSLLERHRRIHSGEKPFKVSFTNTFKYNLCLIIITILSELYRI